MEEINNTYQSAKKNLNSSLFYVSILVLITILTYWRWFFLDKYFVWGDGSFFFRYSELWESYATFFQAWTTRANGLGAYNIIANIAPLEYLIGATTKYFGSSTLGLKLFVYFPAALLAPISSFFLIKHVTKDKLSAFVGAIVYSFNVYILLTNVGGHLPISISYGLTPLFLFLYIKYLDNPQLKSLLLIAVIGFLSSMYEVRIFYINAWLCIFYLIYFTAGQLNQKRFSFKILALSFLPFLLIGLLNLHWIMPLIFSGSVFENAAINRGLFGNPFMKLSQSVAFFHPFWTLNRGITVFEVQPIPLYHWLIPAFVVIGVIGIKKNKLIGFFLILSILGILLTKQSAAPFPNLYAWLYQNWPGFSAFREASKFYVILSLGYSVLIANSIRNLKDLFRENHKKIIVGLFTFVILAIFLVNTTSLINGSAGGVVTPKEVPESYNNLKNLILDDNMEEYRTLWIPATSMWGYADHKKPKIGLYQLYFNYLGTALTSNENYQPMANNSKSIADINHPMLDILTQVNSDLILDLYSIKYTIVPDGSDYEDDNVFQIYGFGEDRQYIVDLLDTLEYLDRKPSVGGITLYENKSFYPRIFATNTAEIDSIHKVVLNRRSWSHYLITTTEPDSSFLFFSDLFDRNWKLFKGNVSYADFLFRKSAFEEVSHGETVAKTNMFILKQEEDSTLANEYTLIYIPQIYTDIGTIVSFSLLAIILVYLSYRLIADRKNDRQ